MARRRFFTEAISGDRATLHGPAAEHLRKVLRVERGQRFELSDGRRAWLAEVADFGKGVVHFALLEELPVEELPVDLHLFAALIKFDHWEWMLEKATELGVSRVVPVVTARCEHGLERAAGKRRTRWERILIESAQQCRRTRLMELAEVMPLRKALAEPAVWRFRLEEAEAQPLLRSMPAQPCREDRIAILVGPEGGWTEAERMEANEHGWQPVSLGPLILRAETASIAAAAVASAAWMSGTAED